jgi:hypothetical protein
MRIREEPMTIIDRLYPIREAFTLAGLRSTKGYAEVSAGRLAVVRNGRRTFVRASEIQRYIDALTTAIDRAA